MHAITAHGIQAYTTSIIAQTEWPEKWPSLFDQVRNPLLTDSLRSDSLTRQLLAALFSENPNAVHGSMRVMTGMMSMRYGTCVTIRVCATHLRDPRDAGGSDSLPKAFPNRIG